MEEKNAEERTLRLSEELLEKFASSLIELGKYEEALLPLGKLTASESASKEVIYSKGIVLLELGRTGRSS